MALQVLSVQMPWFSITALWPELPCHCLKACDGFMRGEAYAQFSQPYPLYLEQKRIFKYSIDKCVSHTLSAGEAWTTCSSNRCQSYMPTVRSSCASIHFQLCNWRQCKGCTTRKYEEDRSVHGNCSPDELFLSHLGDNPLLHLNKSNYFINHSNCHLNSLHH